MGFGLRYGSQLASADNPTRAPPRTNYHKSWPSVSNAAIILVPLEIWKGRGIVAEEEGVDERAARAVGSVVLFNAQGTLLTQRASVAFGDALGRTSSPERRPATLPAIKGGARTSRPSDWEKRSVGKTCPSPIFDPPKSFACFICN